MDLNINVNDKVTGKLNFKPVVNYGKLCVGKLVNVEYVENETSTEKKDGSPSTWEYAGQKLPSIKLSFENHKFSVSEPDRFFTHMESIIGYTRNDGTLMEEKTILDLYTAMWGRLKHIYDAYEGNGNYRKMGDDMVKALKTLGEASMKDVKARLKAFTTFFKLFVDYFNGDNKPVYKDAAGKPIVMAMKLVAEYKEGKWLAFPTFTKGNIFIERYYDDINKQTIEFKPSESIELRSIAKGLLRRDDAPGGNPAEVEDEVMALIRKGQQ